MTNNAPAAQPPSLMSPSAQPTGSTAPSAPAVQQPNNPVNPSGQMAFSAVVNSSQVTIPAGGTQ
jgi:hypothetical protein